MTWVIAYDVSRDRNRTHVSKTLAKEGIRIQKSVFLVEASSCQVKQLVETLGRMIETETDSVCAWPLSEHWKDRQISVPVEQALLQEVFVIG